MQRSVSVAIAVSINALILSMLYTCKMHTKTPAPESMGRALSRGFGRWGWGTAVPELSRDPRYFFAGLASAVSAGAGAGSAWDFAAIFASIRPLALVSVGRSASTSERSSQE